MAKRQPKKPPAYRLHRRSGRAVVTLADARTGRRRDVYLGQHGSTESRAAYARTLADWEAAGRVVEPAAPSDWLTTPNTPAGGATVTGVALAYWDDVKSRYPGDEINATHPQHIRRVLAALRSYAGTTPAEAFGPVKLRELRADFIAKGWNRSTVTRSVGFVRAAFKHAVAVEMIAPAVLEGLRALEPLRAGQHGVREPRKVYPVAPAHVEAVLPYMTRPMRGIVETLRHTGARCGEVVGLTPGMIDRSGEVWRADLAAHKNAHRGRGRVLFFGPKAQTAIRPLLLRPDHAPLFSPVEAQAEARARRHAARKTPASCGNAPGRRSAGSGGGKGNPSRPAGETYATAAVGKAIARACTAAGVPKWTPHQLRHLYATEIRQAAGLEAAAALLGHASAELTDATYAERDEAAAVAAVQRFG